MTACRPRSTALLAALLAALAVTACGEAPGEPCTRADLDQPAPIGMPSAVEVTRTRRLIGARLEPLPTSVRPAVSAARAWRRLRVVRQPDGGGRDELLLGLFSAKGYSGVPAWALFTSHLAQRLDPLTPPSGVTSRPDADACVFVDMLTVLNADTGERFYGSTVTSSGPPRILPAPTTSTRAGEH